MQRILLFLLCLAFGPALRAQSDDASARLLESLLAESKSAPANAPQEGMTVKIYQLAQTRVDTPNGMRAISVLKRWLPGGSTVSVVPATNGLHILTTATAHEAAAELLAALDQAPPANPAAVDPHLKEAIEKFSEVSSQPQEMRRILDEFTGRMNLNLAAAQTATAERQEQQQRRWFYLTTGVGGGTLIIALIVVISAARRRPTRSTELALVPQHFTQIIQPLRLELHEQIEGMANDVKFVVESALQVQRQSDAQRSSELASLKTQLEAYLNKRDSLLETSRVEMEKTATRLNASADAIQASQIKVEALTNQLREAMREIDRLQCVVSEREENLQVQSDLLRAREEEIGDTRSRLSKNLAKLTLLANELGAADTLFSEPLPAFDQLIDGSPESEERSPKDELVDPSPSKELQPENIPAQEAVPSLLVGADEAAPVLCPTENPTSSPSAPSPSWPDVEFHDPANV